MRQTELKEQRLNGLIWLAVRVIVPLTVGVGLALVGTVLLADRWQGGWHWLVLLGLWLSAIFVSGAWLWWGVLRGLWQRSQEMSAIRDQLTTQVREAAMQEERHRLARELHDSIKQQLFTINVSAAAAQTRWIDDDAGAQAALTDVRTSAKEALVEMNALLQQLRPHPLESMGLVAALREQAEALGYRTGATVTTDFEPLPSDDRLPLGTQESLFRIAQEAFANIARHARANKVFVQLGTRERADETMVVLEITDDGRGFDQLREARGMGLRNIQSRTEAVGGQFEVTSVPERGTTIRVSIPIMGGRDVVTGRRTAPPVPSSRMMATQYLSLMEQPLSNDATPTAGLWQHPDALFLLLWAFVVYAASPTMWVGGTLILFVLTVIKLMRLYRRQETVVSVLHSAEIKLHTIGLRQQTAIVWLVWLVQAVSRERPMFAIVGASLLFLIALIFIGQGVKLRSAYLHTITYPEQQRYAHHAVRGAQTWIFAALIFGVLTFLMRQHLVVPATNGVQWLVLLYVVWTVVRLVQHALRIGQAWLWRDASYQLKVAE